MLAVVLQFCGLFIVGAVLLQAGIAVFAEVGHAIRRRQLDRRRLAAFTAQTDVLIRRAESSRQRVELTWSGKRKFRVAKRRIENRAGDICSFFLEPHDGGALPPFLPGQFLTFELNVPDHPVPVVRCYSLSDSPLARDRYRVSIKRIPPPPRAGPDVPSGLSSSYFHDILKEGDIVDVRAPAGGFCLDTASERPAVFIAGGIGLTPVLSMFKWLAETGSRRTAWFFLAVRNSNDIALRDEIRDIADKNRQQFHTVTVYSDPTEQCIEGKDYDCKGFLSVDLLKRYLKTSNYEFYICGPPPMMEAVVKALTEWGVPEPDIHFEAFGPGSVKKVQKPEPEAAAAGAGFKVELMRSRKSLVWTREAGTLLELAEANGIRINSGCRAGNCGTCVTAVKHGNVSYLVKPASNPAAGSALLCIAHPTADIALDA
ncbi:2Fe-2S iron-sulfur cluster binding domain-containing protein [Bradyrhizobium diazoefficiens]|nr:2Fe-2S iron-sulfur cluster-binding protein [Bradyrhizobium diazoefficiens]QQO23277.1 2Fe-2S iron-sulfur cluster binding domain-containing protein [Bradyrhizobium diazoefficiens]